MSNMGGQALIEGVMMKNDSKIARAVYDPDFNLQVDSKSIKLFSDKYKFLKLPFIRGIFNLADMMIIGYDSLLYSLKISSPQEEQPNKNEMVWSFLFSLLLSITLFIVIPAFLFRSMTINFSFLSPLSMNLLEGLFKLLLFWGFIISTLFMKDMREIYKYHGAEHKTVNAYEHKVDLTIDNIKIFSRIHKRCGTAFIAIVIIVSIIIFSFFGYTGFGPRIFLKIVLFPVIAGIGYEIIRISSKLEFLGYFNFLLWPGLFLQLFTTLEPEEKHLKAAVSALEEALNG